MFARLRRLHRESGWIGLAVRPPVRAGIAACDRLSLQLRRLLGAFPLVLRGRHEGQRCFILGNGPSLAEETVSLLRDELLISCNQGQIFTEANGLKPQYHAFVDTIFLGPEFTGFLDEMIRLQAINGTTLLTSSQIAEAIRERVPDAALFETHQFLISDYVRRPNSRIPDLTEAQFGFLSVVHMALTFAIYMGFKEIFLLGCDMDYFLDPGRTLRHSYGDGQFGAVGKTAGELFGWEQADLMAWCLREFRGFEELRRIAEGQGCRIVNAGRSGALNVFERKSLEAVLGRKETGK
jgi:Protein of unknown function DUF115